MSHRGTRANQAKNQAPTGATVVPIKIPQRKAVSSLELKVLDCKKVDNFISHGFIKSEGLEGKGKSLLCPKK